jgi:hypothetical protein
MEGVDIFQKSLRSLRSRIQIIGSNRYAGPNRSTAAHPPLTQFSTRSRPGLDRNGAKQAGAARARAAWARWPAGQKHLPPEQADHLRAHGACGFSQSGVEATRERCAHGLPVVAAKKRRELRSRPFAKRRTSFSTRSCMVLSPMHLSVLTTIIALMTVCACAGPASATYGRGGMGKGWAWAWAGKRLCTHPAPMHAPAPCPQKGSTGANGPIKLLPCHTGRGPSLCSASPMAKPSAPRKAPRHPLARCGRRGPQVEDPACSAAVS